MYVITGATGNTGRVVANRLLDEGKKIRVVGRSLERLQPFTARGAEASAADLSDLAALTQAFRGADAVYAMIPPNLASSDFRAEQRRVTEAIAAALEQTGVKYAVTLSSVGADKEAGTGPVAGLHELEERLNRIAGINIVHLRAGYFMENTVGQAGAIKMLGKTAGPLRGDLKLPMIATGDIGNVAADLLLALDFTGKQTRELLGQRDVDMNEVTRIIGQAIEKPDLAYIQLPDAMMKPAFIQMGLSSNLAGLILEMAAALNSGHMRALEPRSGRNTTPTTFETFVQQQFVPVYRGQSQAA
ncbi:MAG TPA: NAD(P)H-binding protein [Candidatus Angelobacter sp.]|nr:NAD(P)H-binding protein [Candidatus Angelobacter sp.]